MEDGSRFRSTGGDGLGEGWKGSKVGLVGGREFVLSSTVNQEVLQRWLLGGLDTCTSTRVL